MKSGQLDTKIYQKPFNKFLYIPYFSYHSLAQKTAFINGLLTSFLRANSVATTFYAVRNQLFFRLRIRGYPAKYLHPLFINSIYSKETIFLLLEPKSAEAKTSAPLTLKMQASPAVEALKSRDFLKQSSELLRDFDLPDMRLCLLRPPTLTVSLIRSKFRN
jgi:hypothetical protein